MINNLQTENNNFRFEIFKNVRKIILIIYKFQMSEIDIFIEVQNKIYQHIYTTNNINIIINKYIYQYKFIK